eukprot:1111329-Prymnesium_polylepis.2
MSPIPGWLAGAQNVALNMSNVDLAVQVHFALFHGSAGFVLKPREMHRLNPPKERGVSVDRAPSER